MANKKTNYNKMSEKSVKEEAVVETVETTEEVAEYKPVLGSLKDCERLNVRAKPSVEAKVVLILDKGTKVFIDEEKSTNDFYCVCSADGKDIIGFCMKKFITIE